MSTPQQQPLPKGPKRSAKKNKNHMAPAAHARGAVSENELSHAQVDGQQDKGPRRKSQVNKKAPTPVSGNVSDAPPIRTQATPIKEQAYAGATFTNSPAASALPMPSFYSRSVPSSSHGRQPTILEQDSNQPTPVAAQDNSPTKRETTPLDFLFNAARQAQSTPRNESPGPRSHLSISATPPGSRSPGPRDADSMFPFELEGATTPGEDGSSFATPYSERMNAFKSMRPTSNGVRSPMTEMERQEKSSALKQFLMKESTPSPPPNVELNNPFNARPPQMRSGAAQQNIAPRPRSNPSTPNYAGSGQVPNGQYFPPQSHFPQYNVQSHRQSSNLRNHFNPMSDGEYAELSSDSAHTPPRTRERISTARKPSTSADIAPGLPSPVSTGQYAPEPMHQKRPSVAQMEEQMRNFLKLDLISKG